MAVEPPPGDDATARATYLPITSHSRFTRVPTLAPRRFVCVQVCGMIWTSKRIVAQRGDRQADAVDRDRPFQHEQRRELLGGNRTRIHVKSPRAARQRPCRCRPRGPGRSVRRSAQSARIARSRFTARQARDRRARSRAASRGRGRTSVAGLAGLDGRQAHAVDRDAVAAPAGPGRDRPRGTRRTAPGRCSTAMTSPTASMRPVNIAGDQYVGAHHRQAHRLERRDRQSHVVRDGNPSRAQRGWCDEQTAPHRSYPLRMRPGGCGARPRPAP